MARVGAIVTPFVAQVITFVAHFRRSWKNSENVFFQVAAKKSVNIPISIYGTMCLLGAGAALLLPIETKGREMKDTH